MKHRHGGVQTLWNIDIPGNEEGDRLAKGGRVRLPQEEEQVGCEEGKYSAEKAEKKMVTTTLGLQQ